MSCLGLVGIFGLVEEQSSEGVGGEPAIVAKVATCDQLTVRMSGQPVAASAEKLVDFFGTDPVVLVVIEHGQEDKQVLEEVP